MAHGKHGLACDNLVSGRRGDRRWQLLTAARGIDALPFIWPRSISKPPSEELYPATLWPRPSPPHGSRVRGAKSTEFLTSAAPAAADNAFRPAIEHPVPYFAGLIESWRFPLEQLPAQPA